MNDIATLRGSVGRSTRSLRLPSLAATAGMLAFAAAPTVAGDRIHADGFEPCCRIGGSVSGLAGSIVLHLHSGAIDDDEPVSGDGPYQFLVPVAPGANYALSVNAPQPAGLTCAFTISSGIMGSSAIDNANVACVDNPPDTTISLASKPSNPSASTSASFSFTSSEAGSTFTCQLDAAAPVACDSGGKAYANLVDGQHTFSVYATDTAANDDPTPASYTWIVAGSAPAFDQAPPAAWPVNYFDFAFSGPVAGTSGYQCSQNGAAYATCASPLTITSAYTGNSFSVRWIDAKGNHSAAQTTSWTATPGLVLYYPFNEDAANYSVLEYPFAYFSHDGNAPPAIQGGYAGGASSFSTGVSFANTARPLSSGTGYAVSVWIYDPPSPGTATVWRNSVNGSAGCGITATSASNTAQLTCVDASGATIGSATGSIVKGWNNLALQYLQPGGAADFYINGSLVGTAANPGQINLFPASQQMTLGPTSPFLVDELRVYNTSFSAATLCGAVLRGVWDSQQSSCQPPILGMHYAFDDATPVNRGAWTGIGPLSVAEAPSPGVVGGAYQFNSNAASAFGFAANDHPDLDLTLSAWFYDSAGAGRVFDVSCTAGDATCSGKVGGVYAALNQGTLTVCALAPLQNYCANSFYMMNQWNQLALVSDEFLGPGGSKTNTIDIYLNAELVGQLFLAGATNPWANANSAITIGQGFSGYIDEVKLWGTTLPLSGDDLCTLAFGGVVDPVDGTCSR
jgi:hypothetical protein